MLLPKYTLEKDDDGNLPIHIIITSKEVSDEENLFLIKNMLVYTEFEDGEIKYCCEDCFNSEPKKHSHKTW